MADWTFRCWGGQSGNCFSVNATDFRQIWLDWIGLEKRDCSLCKPLTNIFFSFMFVCLKTRSLKWKWGHQSIFIVGSMIFFFFIFTDHSGQGKHIFATSNHFDNLYISCAGIKVHFYGTMAVTVASNILWYLIIKSLLRLTVFHCKTAPNLWFNLKSSPI